MHLERFLKRSYDHTEPTFCGMQALFSVAYAKQQMVELIGSRQVFVGFALRVCIDVFQRCHGRCSSSPTPFPTTY